MNLAFVQTFLCVVRRGSFRAAADKLNLTQAAVSNRIASLEAELGRPLFERTSGPVRLTPTGQRAIDPAEALLRAAATFQAVIADPASIRGRIAIGTIDTVVHSWLPRFVEQVRERYPGLTLDLDVDTSLNIGRSLGEGRIDLALAIGPVMAPGLKSIEIGEFRCAWVAAPSQRLGGRRLAHADLARHPIFAFSRHSQPHEWLAAALAAEGIRGAQISHSNSLATVMRLVRDGMGVAPLPLAILDDALARGELEILDVAPPFMAIRLHAIYADHPDAPIRHLLAEIARKVSLDAASNEVGDQENPISSHQD